MSSSASFQTEAGCRPIGNAPDGYLPPERADLLADILASGRTLRFKVSGQSMRPAIRSGDYVVLQKPDVRMLRIGDLLLCRQAGGRVVLHRLIAVFRDRNGIIRRLTTKGDSVDICDPPLESEAVLGRVIGIESGRRSVVRRLETKLFFPVNRLLGIYHRIRSDAVCAFVRFKSGRRGRRGDGHAA